MKNNSLNLHKKTTNSRILVVVVKINNDIIVQLSYVTKIIIFHSIGLPVLQSKLSHQGDMHTATIFLVQYIGLGDGKVIPKSLKRQ